MKKLIKINYLTYFFILSAILCGMFKECLILLLVIIIHELGHVIIIKYYKYKINCIELLPFGGITKIEKDINSSLNKEIMISIAGILMQLILFIATSFLYYHNFLSHDIYYLFKKYNLSILIFNLLPIIPLDGSIFIRSLLEKFLSFRLANIISVYLSLVILCLFIYLNYILQLNNYLIGIFLLYKIIVYIKEYKYLENRFLLERYLNNYNYSKIKRIKDIKDMSKEKIHYMTKNNKIIKEKEILCSYFRY